MSFTNFHLRPLSFLAFLCVCVCVWWCRGIEEGILYICMIPLTTLSKDILNLLGTCSHERDAFVCWEMVQLSASRKEEITPKYHLESFSSRQDLFLGYHQVFGTRTSIKIRSPTLRIKRSDSTSKAPVRNF